MNPIRRRLVARLGSGSGANCDGWLCGRLSASLLGARRPDKAAVDTSISARSLLNEALVLKHVQHFGNLILTDIAVGVLAATELERKAHLVSFTEELANLAQLVLQVTDIRTGMELDFLHLRSLLSLALLLGLDGFLVAEFPVVHDLAHGRLGVWGNLHQIEPLTFSQALSLIRRHNAEHLTVCVKNAHRRHADLVVYASERSDNTPLFAVVKIVFTVSIRQKRVKL